jgi:hypothetical protein
VPDLLEKTGKIGSCEPTTSERPTARQTTSSTWRRFSSLNAIDEGAYGFQLRNDANVPARRAMFSLACCATRSSTS